MSARRLTELLSTRMGLIGDIARLTGSMQQAVVAAGGTSIEILRSQRVIARDGETGDSRAALDKALSEEAEAKAMIADLEARILELEARVEAVDKEIAGAWR